MTTRRQVNETGLFQGVEESIPYSLDCSPWSATPSGPRVQVFDMNGSYADVTSTVLLTGSVYMSDYYLIFKLRNMTRGHKYRVEMAFSGPSAEIAGATGSYEAWAEIEGER